MENIELLIIDPQRDFCSPHGSLYVPGADEDMERLGSFIKRSKDKISNITVTLDKHYKMQIFHQSWWVNKDGNHPPVFTLITVKDVEDGVWTTAVPEYFKKSLEYLKELEIRGRFNLCIWPDHCIAGSQGATIYQPVFDAISEWTYFSKKNPELIEKGTNLFTESYSGVQAEVQIADDKSTHTNFSLISKLKHNDILIVAGEAQNFCVYNTVKDIIEQHRDDVVKKLILLKDCMSPIPGFKDTLFKEAGNRGATIINSIDLTL